MLLRTIGVHPHSRVYRDSDAVWLKDPYPYIKPEFDAAFQMDGDKWVCGGFIFLRWVVT